MQYRHELKHEINYSDMIAIRMRLRAVASSDPHAVDGRYEIRSLYFDNTNDKALREKIDGVNQREKFRIRFYNGDTSFISLEKKSKLNSMGNKQSARLTAEEAQQIADGTILSLSDMYEESGAGKCSNSSEATASEDPSLSLSRTAPDRPLLLEFYRKMQCEGLRAKTIVDYTREPFIFAPGNVRVTFDYHIRTGIRCTDFLNPDCPMVPVQGDPIILEVKWDDYLPSIIRDAVNVPGRHAAAFSKYQACRAYG